MSRSDTASVKVAVNTLILLLTSPEDITVPLTVICEVRIWKGRLLLLAALIKVFAIWVLLGSVAEAPKYRFM